MRHFSWLLSAALLATGCSCTNESSNPGPFDQGVGEACSSDTNCRSGLLCTDGTCQPSHDGTEGQACVLSDDCTDTLYCGPSRTCEMAGAGGNGADCASTADCTHGLLCTVEGIGFRCRSAGSGDIGATCQTGSDCLAGLRCTDTSNGRTCQNPAVVMAGDGGVGTEPPPTLPLWAGEDCMTDEGPPTAYFHVPRGDATDHDFYRLPFPNDVRKSASGIDLSGHPTPGDAVRVDVLGRVIDAAQQDLDGFATNPVVFFRFSRDFEWGDVTGDRLRLIDVTPGSPDYGHDFSRGWLTTSGAISRYICPSWLALRRGHGDTLRPGTTYAVVLLRGVRTSEADGHDDFASSSDLDALLADTAPSDSALTDAYGAYAPLRAWLAEDTSPAPSDILNATVFTTQDPTAMVPALRTAIRGADAPAVSDLTVCDTGVTSPCDDGDLRVCSAANDAYWEIHARIALPQFQAGTPPYETPDDGGAIQTDASGAPTVARTEPVCMVMTVPKVDSAPADGFPLVIYAHGTGGAFTAPVANGLAQTFATGDVMTNAVTVAIDMPLHGSRRGDSTRSPDVLVYNFANPRAARDNIVQGAADLMSLVYWAEGYTLATADGPAGFDVAFDPSRVVLFGHSQGATHAQLMVPFEPGVRSVLLSGAGGDLTESLLTKTLPVNIAGALPLALLDVDGSGHLPAGENNPALALIQMFFERSDPVNYGRLMASEPLNDTGRDLFMTYGLGDHYSTEETLKAYAHSASLTLVGPQLVDIGLGMPAMAPLNGNVMIAGAAFTVGLRQYQPNPGDDGHFVSTQTTDGRADVTRFVLQALSGATPDIGM